MPKNDDLVQLIVVIVVLFVAFPAIGATILDAVTTGLVIGVAAAVVIGFLLWFFWYNK